MLLCRVLLSWAFLFIGYCCGAQTFQFAHVTDTHVGGATGAEDLRRTVADLNLQTDIDFVVFSGDITEFGSDMELALAKQILDSLQLPWYIVPGNHDSNWSESGANSFRKVFGAETFFFKHKGYHFMGTTSGPNMRMSPGQIPRENLVWMDSIFAAHPDVETPLIAINHYPLDSSLNNWFEATDRLKRRNVQLALCGHGHVNKLFNWDGIPGVMGRSNLRAKEAVGAYNVVTIGHQKAVYRLRQPQGQTAKPWLEVPLLNHRFAQQQQQYPRPDYAVNQRYAEQVKPAWTFQDDSDLGAGFARFKDFMITGNTKGQLYALDLKTGKKRWSLQTGGKIYATPAVWKNTVVVGSSDGNIYGVNAKNGRLIWTVKTAKAVLGSPVVEKGVAYIGGSDGSFRALDIRRGTEIWAFNQLKGYVTTQPARYQNLLIFGDWGNGFYALDKNTGQRIWEWDNGHKNRMFSAAAVYPVVYQDRVYIVAPDRFMTCLSAVDGTVIWREKHSEHRVRESIGLAADGRYVYAKTMDGKLIGVATQGNSMQVDWVAQLQLPYELTPSAIAASGNTVFVPSHSGLLSAVEAKSGALLWQYKISNAMINPIYVIDENQVLVSTMDGLIVKLNLHTYDN